MTKVKWNKIEGLKTRDKRIFQSEWESLKRGGFFKFLYAQPEGKRKVYRMSISLAKFHGYEDDNGNEDDTIGKRVASFGAIQDMIDDCDWYEEHKKWPNYGNTELVTLNGNKKTKR